MIDPIVAAGPDPVAFTTTLLESLQPASAIEDVPVIADRAGQVEPPFLLVQDRLAVRDRGVGAYLPARVKVTAFGRSPEEAAAVYREASRLLHQRGPVSNDHGRAWRVFEEVGAQPVEDPDTKWSTTFGVFDLYMADR